MMLRTGVAAALGAAAALFACHPASAQDDTLRALAQRLARDSAIAPADIEIDAGTIPALPVAFTPPSGARILGTAVERSRAGQPVGQDRYARYRVYFTASQAPKDLVDAVAAGFSRAGYKPLPIAYGPARGGFPTGVATEKLCRGDADPTLFIRARSASGGTDAVLEEMSPTPGSPGSGGPCDAQRAVQFEPELPVLRSAPAIAVAVRTNAATPDAVTQTADVFTALAPRAILDGWAGQAVAEGWAERSIASSDAVATASFTREMGGRLRLLTMSVARVRAGHYYASVINAITPAEPSEPAPGR